MANSINSNYKEASVLVDNVQHAVLSLAVGGGVGTIVSLVGLVALTALGAAGVAVASGLAAAIVVVPALVVGGITAVIVAIALNNFFKEKKSSKQTLHLIEEIKALTPREFEKTASKINFEKECGRLFEAAVISDNLVLGCYISDKIQANQNINDDVKSRVRPIAEKISIHLNEQIQTS